jgi:hypothetical protein
MPSQPHRGSARWGHSRARRIRRIDSVTGTGAAATPAAGVWTPDAMADRLTTWAVLTGSSAAAHSQNTAYFADSPMQAAPADTGQRMHFMSPHSLSVTVPDTGRGDVVVPNSSRDAGKVQVARTGPVP